MFKFAAHGHPEDQNVSGIFLVVGADILGPMDQRGQAGVAAMKRSSRSREISVGSTGGTQGATTSFEWGARAKLLPRFLNTYETLFQIEHFSLRFRPILL